MKKLLPCTALVMCAGMACAQAEEKNDWHFNIGAMYEIENVEGLWQRYGWARGAFCLF